MKWGNKIPSILRLSLISAITAAFVGCNGGGGEPLPEPNSIVFLFPKEIEYNYTYPYGSTVEISTTESWSLTVTDAATGLPVTWLTLSPSSGTGKMQLELSNTENDAYERTARIKVTFQTSTDEVIVRQKGRYSPVTDIPGWKELPAVEQNEDRIFLPLYAQMNGQRSRNYSILYDKNYKAALWVAYPLHPDHRGSGNLSTWRVNPYLPESYQIRVSSGYGASFPEGNANYYARGHQIPNADRNGIREMQEQTYYYTNSTPQIMYGFNSGVWSGIENSIRTVLNRDKDSLWVVTGPVFKTVGGNEEVKYITNSTSNGGEQVPVANYYYKIVLKAKGDSYSAVGFWVEHKYYSVSPTAQDVSCTVREIEQKTGFNFFANLPQSQQDIFENAVINYDWF